MKHEYWFKRKRYGWGWVPVTWQGWGLMGLFLVFLIAGSIMILGNTNEPSVVQLSLYLGHVLVLVGGLIWATARKAPPGKWRWGANPTDDPECDI